MISDNEKKYIGIDIGGTFIKGGVIKEDGTIIAESKIPSESNLGADHTIDNVNRLIALLLQESNLKKEDICGIGAGVPGMIDSKAGEVTFNNNLGWRKVPLAKKIADATGLNVKIANDANVAALGETVFGAGKQYNTVAMVTLGTGVGSGIVLNGKMFEGNRSAGAEIGHTVIEFGGEPCTCGRRGCFEAYSSATALIRDTKRAMLKHKDSKMWEIGDIEKVDGSTPFAYAKTDVYAKEVVDNYVAHLACGLCNIANVFRPEAILIGGGVCGAGDDLIIPLQKAIDKELYGGEHGPSVPVRVASLKNHAGILGAAALWITERKDVFGSLVEEKC